MNMTREEAINRIEDHMAVHHIGEYPHFKLKEALDFAISALRPVSREQVEKVWEKCQHSRVCGTCKVCVSGRYQQANFCAACGAPLTDEAVQMVMERLEALKDAGD